MSPMIAPSRHKLDADSVSLGRAADCTIPIKDRYLSRKHAEIVPGEGAWVLKDCGSANGTYLNGIRVDKDSPLRSGDRIKLGDTEILFQTDVSTDRFSIPESPVNATISIPVREITSERPEVTGKSLERLRILNSLALELIEDHPLDKLFGFILDRVMEHLRPSRAAIGIIGDGESPLQMVEVRRQRSNDTAELSISKTLLNEIVVEKKALAFVDISIDEKLSKAMSIVAQGIHSVLAAPMMIGEAVVGVLYVDFFFTQRSISEEDVRLVAQIAQFAAVKLENTRLRESAIQKRLMDEELKTAYVIQRRLLPHSPPSIPGYSFSGLNRPCRTVSGDYYDFVVRPSGKIYFTIADVSGKGLTAALIMAGLQSAFRIFTTFDPTPSELLTRLNAAMKENLPQSKFVTLFAGFLDPSTGTIDYANAGHNPPVHVARDGITSLESTDLILGLFANAQYRDQQLILEPGDALVMFTDGVTEAAKDEVEEYGNNRVLEVVSAVYGNDATSVGNMLERSVLTFMGEERCADDVTIIVIGRDQLEQLSAQQG